MITGAIFDVDGTILNSMEVWHNCGARYLEGLGIQAEPGLGDYLFTQTNETGAYYLIEHYGLDKDPEEIAAGMSQEMERYYFQEAELKEGAIELLEDLKDRGIPMTVATSTDRYLIEGGFRRLGLDRFFPDIFTCTEAGATKEDPRIFFQASESLRTDPADTWVFEDGLYAVKTAKEAGFRTAAVFDTVSRSDWDELKGLADVAVKSLTELDPACL